MDNELKNRSGFVNILGIPNSGKSTLINKLVGKKISIVSHKVQTTRFCVKGISLYDIDKEKGIQSQIIFIDTPGIFDAKRRLDKAMVSAAWSELKYCDNVIFIHDVSRAKINDETLKIIEKLIKIKASVILVLNKIDFDIFSNTYFQSLVLIKNKIINIFTKKKKNKDPDQNDIYPLW